VNINIRQLLKLFVEDHNSISIWFAVNLFMDQYNSQFCQVTTDFINPLFLIDRSWSWSWSYAKYRQSTEQKTFSRKLRNILEYLFLWNLRQFLCYFRKKILLNWRSKTGTFYVCIVAIVVNKFRLSPILLIIFPIFPDFFTVLLDLSH